MDKSLNKYISETGFCSRREADKYIDQGRVTINDNIAVKGNRVLPGDVVEIDGEPIKKKDKTVYLVFNKPVGITCTTDLKDKHNIISFINYKSRIFPIGRLDKPSEGLIFLTNDGDIVNKILRAGNNHEKEYVVTTDKPISGDFGTACAYASWVGRPLLACEHEAWMVNGFFGFAYSSKWDGAAGRHTWGTWQDASSARPAIKSRGLATSIGEPLESLDHSDTGHEES